MIKISQSQLDMQEIDRVYADLIAPKVVTHLTEFYAKETEYTTHTNPNVRYGFSMAASFLSGHALDSRIYDVDTLKRNVLKYSGIVGNNFSNYTISSCNCFL